MLDADTTREQVSESYAAALSSSGGGCCGDPADTAAADHSGYDAVQLATLPADAVTNSFGCGDPVAFTEIEAGDVVLDLGSGAGIDLLLAAEKVGPEGKVIGVDMTDEMIQRARENVEKAGFTNVEVRKGLIEDLPVEAESVDWVISNCVINLSPEKPRVFAEIARVLRPGGRMMVSDIVAERLPRRLRKSRAAYDSCLAGAIGEKEYLAGLEAAGLVDVRSTARQVYDPIVIEDLVASELASSKIGRLGRPIRRLATRITARFLAGRIWSSRFVATKPHSA